MRTIENIRCRRSHPRFSWPPASPETEQSVHAASAGEDLCVPWSRKLKHQISCEVSLARTDVPLSARSEI